MFTVSACLYFKMLLTGKKVYVSVVLVLLLVICLRRFIYSVNEKIYLLNHNNFRIKQEFFINITEKLSH